MAGPPAAVLVTGTGVDGARRGQQDVVPAQTDTLAPGFPRDLARLADAYGVATSYEDQNRRRVHVSPQTVVAVLAALGVDAATPQSVAAALDAHRLRAYRRVLTPTVVVRAGVGGHVAVHHPVGCEPSVAVLLEDGGQAGGLSWLGVHVGAVDVDGEAMTVRTLVLPAGLPLGYHRIVVRLDEREHVAALVVAPDRLELAPGLGRVWGWMVQLYAVRSRRSWGVGDLADLAELARWSGQEHGAGLLVVNPLHASAPVPPLQASPYFPASRRFVNPLYLRVEQTPEYAAAAEHVRRAVDALAAPARALDGSDRVDRDAVWQAKLAALEALWAGAPRRPQALAAFRAGEGGGLEDFATWCALAERHGADCHDWPEDLRHPSSPGVAGARAQLRDRIEFFAWLQLLCDEQLRAVQEAARAAGMPLGVVHDLAVGSDPAGADAWALQDVLALDTRIGAPPDAFNQLGQDWGLPPWRPDRLAETGYEAFVQLLRSQLRHAGALRIDHILGLFRLWWIPPGANPRDGTYVRYDVEALLGVTLLEAHRAGAVVVGEDLGTVEPGVRQVLAERGVRGSSVLWFERAEDPRTREDRGPAPLADWRELTMASVTTHDLPTAAGWLRGEHVRVRAELGQLDRPVEQERAQAAVERGELLALLRAEGLLDVGPEPDEEQLVAVLHRALGRTPSRLVAAALWDAVGDLRQPNLPGTVDEYPNWRLPIATHDETGRPVPLLLEDIEGDARVRRLADVLAVSVRDGSRRSSDGVE